MITTLAAFSNRAMVFSRFFSRFSPQNKTPQEKKRARFLLPSKDEHIRLTLEEAQKYAEQENLKHAIKTIDKGLKAGLPSSKLLNQKAHYLVEKGAYSPAQEIWENLKNDDTNPELARSAAQSLKLCQQRQTAFIKKSKALLKYFHTLAKRQQQALQFIPKPKDWKSNQDLSAKIAQEVEKLRIEGLAKLSLLIADRAHSEGHISPAGLQQKALSLAVCGKIQEAQAILNNLLQNETDPKLQQTLRESLQDINSERKQYLKNRSRYLIKRCHSFAEANSWNPVHIPKPRPKKLKIIDLKAKKLVLQEIKLVLDAGKHNIALGMIDIIFEFYDHSPQALQLKAKSLFDSDQFDSAIETLKPLLASKNSTVSTKALKLARNEITGKAKQLNEHQTADEVIAFFIDKHLQYGIAPEFNDQIGSILATSPIGDSTIEDRELRQQELQLQFNSALIDHLEARLKKAA